jgi:hypothetical protein
MSKKIKINITVAPDDNVFRATLGEHEAVAATPYEAEADEDEPKARHKGRGHAEPPVET